jgi:N5-(cytidine 5'-diphosphoramidyl)-L-glutamine hydrolase
MRVIAVSQRVDVIPIYKERRDALDQRWTAFLYQAGYLPLLLPNQADVALKLMTLYQVSGLLLTGGNSLESCGGDSPERDLTEKLLVEYAVTNSIPTIGICRGMQFLQQHFGQSLEPVTGHVSSLQSVHIGDEVHQVNSYHHFATTKTNEHWSCFARASDGVVKGIIHKHLPINAIMWHPERIEPFRSYDIEFIQKVFK